MSERYIPEKVIRRLLKTPVGCCNSCHEDADEFGYSLCDIDLGKNRRAEVCCVIQIDFDKKKVSTEK